jgi:hypothetical protein
MNIEGGKQYIFFPEEPDVVTIVRSVNFTQAKMVAEKALESFKAGECGATMVVYSPVSIEGLDPRKLDQIVATALQNRNRSSSEGKVYGLE